MRATIPLLVAALGLLTPLISARGQQPAQLGGPSVLTLLPSVGQLEVGNRHPGALTPADHRSFDDRPVQVWELTLDRDQSVSIDLLSNAFDPYLYVIGPGLENTLFDDDGAGGCNSRIQFHGRVGTFRVAVTSVGAGPMVGSFEIVVGSAPGASTQDSCNEFPADFERFSTLPTVGPGLPIGSETSGELRAVDAVGRGGRTYQAWALDGIAGQPVSVDLISDAFDAMLFLTGPGIAGALSDDDGAGGCHARITTALPETGRYRVIVSSLRPGATGPFILHVSAAARAVSPDPCGGPTFDPEPFLVLPTVGRIPPAEEVRGALTTDDELSESGSYVQAWEIETEAGEAVTVDLRSGDFDAYLFVVGEGVALSDDDGAGGCDARVEFTPPQSGTYRVIVSTVGARSTGAFSLRAARQTGPPDPAPCEGLDNRRLEMLPTDGRRIEIDTPAAGVLTADDPVYTDNSAVQAWALVGSAGESVTVDLVSDDFDAYLYLVGPGISPLDDDDGAGGCDARITFTPPFDAVYKVVAGTVSAGEYGRYTITAVRDAEPPSGEICR